MSLKGIFKKLMKKKKLLIRNGIIAIILSAVWVFPKPRTYTSSVTLVPETENSSGALSSLSSVASSFGVNLGDMSSTDAFYPLLYPDIVSSDPFLIGLLNVRVKTSDGSIDTDYLTYLLDHQKTCIWDKPKTWIRNALKALSGGSKNAGKNSDKEVNPFKLTERQSGIIESMRATRIVCSVDRKTEVIEIKVTDQDPLICATMADSVRAHLQEYITTYRTKKSRNDMEYYAQLVEEAKAEYEAVTREYDAFCDSHNNVLLQSLISKRNTLENEMQTKLQTYSLMSTQYEAAKAKVQERTPAFITLNQATVPLKPSGPKRMQFIIGMLTLTLMATGAWILRKDIFSDEEEDEEKEEEPSKEKEELLAETAE